jgi:hypothetical protein
MQNDTPCTGAGTAAIRSGIAKKRTIAFTRFAAVLWGVLFLLFGSLLKGTPLPASRTIDWSQVGIPGGVPSANWPIYTTLSPSGTPDDSVAIQTALNAAPPGSVVLLNPGTYLLHRSSIVGYNHADDWPRGVYECGLYLNKSVVLRGAGPDKTVLKYGDGANIVSVGNTFLSASDAVFIPITSAALKGATSIALANTTNISAGSYLVITQTNPPDADGTPLVNTDGYGGDSASGHDLRNYAMTQIDRVVSVTRTTVTLERPLYFDYVNGPTVYELPGVVENAGLENLRVQSTASSGTGMVYKNINLESCSHCWVVNCESDWCVDKSHIYLSDCYGCEIRNNYVYEAYSHNSGEDYSIYLEFRNSENLIENNIARKARHSMIMNGGSGNVFAYNFCIEPYMGEYPNSLPENDTHGAHPYMNLWEGNIAPNFEFDFTHGSSSHNTVFRNYFNTTSTNPATGQPMTSALYAVVVAYYNNYENMLGNVIGLNGSPSTAGVYQINADATQVPCIYKIGYYDDGGTSTPNAALSAKVEQTMLRGGNWDSVTNTVIWSNNVPSGSLASSYPSSRTLPPSLFRSSAPGEFVATGADWPPIDPAGATKVTSIPAQLCYQKQNIQNGGTFNPNFYSQPGLTPAPASTPPPK